MAAKKKKKIVRKKTVLKKAVKKKTIRKKAVKKKTIRKKAVKKKTVRKKAVKKKTVRKKAIRKKTAAKKTVRKTSYKKKGSAMAKGKKKKSTKKRTRGSAPRWKKKSTVGEVMTNLLVGVGGAVGSAAIANRSKIENGWIKASLPLGAGFALLMSKWGKKDFVAYLSTGAMFMGALSLLKKANPALVEIAGDDYYDQFLPYSDDLSQIEYMGENVDFGNEDDTYFEGEEDDTYFEGETVDIDGEEEDEEVEWVSADVSNTM